MKTQLLYTLLCCVALSFISCDSEDAWDMVKTSGAPKTEVRTLSAFKKLVISNNVNVVLQKGTSYGAELNGWTNLLPKVRLTVSSDSVLTIEDKNSFEFVRSPNRKTTVYLSYVEELGDITFNGDGLLSNVGIMQPASLQILSEDASGSIRLQVNTSGVYVGTNHRNTADIMVSGTASYVGITNWGNAPIDFSKLSAVATDIHHHGAANLQVNASGNINATLYSIGNLYYKGNPSIVLVRKGKGNVIQTS